MTATFSLTARCAIALALSACSASPVMNPCIDAVPLPPPPSAPLPKPSLTLTLAPYQEHGHRTLNVTVGNDEQMFLFDTGGGFSMIVPASAKAVACEPFGNIVGFRMRGERIDLPRCENITLRLGDHPVAHAALGVFDINALLPPSWPKLGGVIALSSFEGQVVSVDLAHNRVDVMPPPIAAGAAPLELVRQASGFSTVALVPVTTATGTLWLELDSGSSGPLLLAPHAAKMLGIDLEAADVTFTPSQDDASKGTWSVPRVTITLPNVGPVETSATVMDMIYDGNIGAPLMARFRFTLDLENERVIVANAAP